MVYETTIQNLTSNYLTAWSCNVHVVQSRNQTFDINPSIVQSILIIVLNV